MKSIKEYIFTKINNIASRVDAIKTLDEEINALEKEINALEKVINENQDTMHGIGDRIGKLESGNRILLENHVAIFNKLYKTEKEDSEQIILDTIPDSINYFNKYPEFFDALELYRAKNEKNNTIDTNRLYMFIMNIRNVLEKNVEGAFAELGVYKGNNAAVMHMFCKKHKRNLYILDTFEGFSEKDLVGVDAHQQKQFEDTSLEGVKLFVGESEFSHYIKGYFPDSVTNELRNDSYAFVSLDCDLYKPIKNGLEFFYPRLNKGGMIFVHDYSSGFFEGCKKAVDEYCAENSISFVLMPDKSGTAVIVK